MEKELVTIEETYNREGYLIKMTANDIPLFIPEQDFPRVNFTNFNMEDVEWVSQRRLLTKEEFKKLYPHE